MRGSILPRLTIVLLVLVSGVGSLISDDGEKNRIAELVRQLGDDDFTRREEATQQLEKIGEAALPALDEAIIKIDDLEVRMRATKLTRVILEGACKSKTTGMKLAVVDAGEFSMGSPDKEQGRRPDEALTAVRITRTFLMGAHEVTQADFQKLMKFNPSAFQAKGEKKDRVAGMDTSQFPVENVTWFDAIEFCNRLSKQDGFEPYYELTDVKRDGDAIKEAKVKILGSNGYRLPTEAEWERACRANTTTRFNFSDVTRQGLLNCKPLFEGGYGAGFKWPELKRTEKVGTFPANKFGLYDMHGNVAEWCSDWYDKDAYSKAKKDDPSGPETGKQRSIRSGSWMVGEESCRSASRYFLTPEDRKDYLGFRVVRSLGRPAK